MTLWLAIPLALLLLVILLFVLVLASSIHFHLRVCRLGKDDRIEFDIKAVFGLVKFHYELPALVFENLEQGIKVKLEKSGIAPVKRDSDREEQIDKESVTEWLRNIRKALKATRGLKKWLNGTLAHVRITKLDWSTDFSLGDAAYTATTAGALWGMKWTLIGWVSRFIRLEHNPRLFVAPVFSDEPCFSTEAVCTGSISAGYACYAGLLLLRRVSKVEGRLAQMEAIAKQVGTIKKLHTPFHTGQDKDCSYTYIHTRRRKTMSDHPIQGLMQTAMENIKGMVDVNTIVGDPVETPDGSVILPISKVAFGFAAGGSDFRVEDDAPGVNGSGTGVKMLPFGGGSGGGVSIRPIAFLVVGREGVHIVPLDNQTHLFEKIIDATPNLIDKIQNMFQPAGIPAGADVEGATVTKTVVKTEPATHSSAH